MKDGFSKIAERAFKRERQISHTPFSINKRNLSASKSVSNESLNQNSKIEKTLKRNVKSAENKIETVLEKVEKLSSSKKESQIILKKSLTDREQMVFEYLLNNKGKTVFAKDLAKLLDLPRDYVYKYIKNLRAKIEGDKLKNVPSGGFVLTD